MEKITLKLGDILQLEHEINGYSNPETGNVIYQGFLKQNLSIILKYELSELGDLLTKERKKIETLRDELIVKYGEESEKGGVMVKMFIGDEYNDEGDVINKIVNPKYIEFDNEYGILLNQEKEIEYPEITKDDLKDAGKTNDQYVVLFKLIKKGSI